MLLFTDRQSRTAFQMFRDQLKQPLELIQKRFSLYLILKDNQFGRNFQSPKKSSLRLFAAGGLHLSKAWTRNMKLKIERCTWKLWKWRIWNYWQVVDVVVDGIPQKPEEENVWRNKFGIREKSWFTDWLNNCRHFESNNKKLETFWSKKLTSLFHCLHLKHLTLKWVLVSPVRCRWFKKDLRAIPIPHFLKSYIKIMFDKRPYWKSFAPNAVSFSCPPCPLQSVKIYQEMLMFNPKS